MHFVYIIIFRGRTIFILSGVALLNWFTKSFKFGVGFNNNELFWAPFSSFHCKNFYVPKKFFKKGSCGAIFYTIPWFTTVLKISILYI